MRRVQPPPKPRRSRRPRRYHLTDDSECVFDTENPDWLVGAN